MSASNKKIKVLWFSNTPANGVAFLGEGVSGSGSWLRTLDLALQKEVDLNIAFYNSSDMNFVVGETKYWGIQRYQGWMCKIIEKFSERFFDRVLDDQHLDRYLSIIEQVNPDVIHIHGSENPFGAIIGKVSAPVVLSVQGLICAVLNSYPSSLGERFLNVRNFAFDSLKNLIFPTNFKNVRLKFEGMARVEKKNLRYCKNIIGRTHWDRRMTRLLAPGSRYFHNDEIMREEFALAHWVPRENIAGKLVVHTTADNVYYKGLETIIHTIQHLNDLGVECIWRIAGVHPNDLIVKVLKEKFGKSYPYDSVFFMGKLFVEELIESMLNADCYVLASNIENSPNVLCEAMLLGMPCVASNAGGVGTFIQDQKNGFLVQPGDSYAMASCVVELKANPQVAMDFGLAARQQALLRHNPKSIVNDLISIYREIIMTE